LPRPISLMYALMLIVLSLRAWISKSRARRPRLWSRSF